MFFDLTVDLNEIAAAVRSDAERKAQTLTVLVPTVPLHIHADRERVHQVVFNLLHNAIKYARIMALSKCAATARTEAANSPLGSRSKQAISPPITT